MLSSLPQLASHGLGEATAHVIIVLRRNQVIHNLEIPPHLLRAGGELLLPLAVSSELCLTAFVTSPRGPFTL